MLQTRPRKRRQEQQHRPLTQEELLAEAAQTEIENLRSLEALQAAEEEVKERAAVKRARYSGPYIHYHSKQINGEAVVRVPLSQGRPQKRFSELPPASLAIEHGCSDLLTKCWGLCS